MRVLIGLDGSPFSQNAVEEFASRIWHPGTNVQLLTVVESIENRLMRLDSSHALFEETEQMEAASNYLLKISMDLQKKVRNLAIETTVLTGDNKNRLLQFADEWQPDLIIVGSRGLIGLDPLMLGSVSQAAVEHAPCSVLIARKNTAQINANNILLPVDHSPYSTTAVSWVTHQSWTTPPIIRLVTVLPTMPEPNSRHSDKKKAMLKELYKEMNDSAQHLIEEFTKKINSELGREAASCEILIGEPRQAILGCAMQWPAKLIVMGSHGRTGLTRLLLGSVSKTVSAHAACSVEVIRTPS